MNIIVPHSDRVTQEYRWRSGAKNTAIINDLVRYTRGQGLLSSLRLYPFMPRTNAGTGATVYGVGLLTANEMTLVNGPTWGAGGLAFDSASSQYGSIPDFLGSETLTVWFRQTFSASPPASTNMLFDQGDSLTDLSRRAFINTAGLLGLQR